jgi:hypothetical protein
LVYFTLYFNGLQLYSDKIFKYLLLLALFVLKAIDHDRGDDDGSIRHAATRKQSFLRRGLSLRSGTDILKHRKEGTSKPPI